jgi:predicted acyltransferase
MQVQSRFAELDTLRGIAILLMVLSGSIAFGGVLPGWMYHAQVPPPLHRFNPALPGITWVDLVFPCFLFSMGAAMPLALSRRLQRGQPLWQVLAYLLRRALLLGWLAFYFAHTKPWALSADAYSPAQRWIISLASFALLFVMFYPWPQLRQAWQRHLLQWGAVGLSAWQVAWLQYADGQPFRLGRVDIIILVLANMALAGALLWLATRQRPWWRVGVLLFIMGVFLCRDVAGSWQQWLYQLTPSSQVYQFYFLKYLFIVVPGTLVGDWLLAAHKPSESDEAPAPMLRRWLLVLPWLLVGLNLWGLYTRHLVPNVLGSLLLCIGLCYWCRRWLQQHLLRRLAEAGSFLLLLGLTFEAWEGGIKKDSSTYSYYFVCSGLAMLLLLSLRLALQHAAWQRYLQPVWATGQNPLLAYVAGALLLTPLLGLTQLLPWWEGLQANAWQGLLKGLLYTSAVAALTWAATRRGWVWKS